MKYSSFSKYFIIKFLATYTFMLVIISVFYVSSVYSAEINNCAACGKIITKEFVEVNGKNYHRWCFVCSVCSDPISESFSEKDGKFYHAECYKRHFAPRCGVCGEPIIGYYTLKEGKHYHETCYMEKIALRCDACGEPLIGQYIENYWGQRIHSEHENKVKKCDSCGRFVLSETYWTFADDRIQCNICREQGIDDVDQARKLMRQAAAMMLDHGIELFTPVENFKIELVNSSLLEELSGKGGDPHGLHSVNSITRNGVIIKEETTIYLLIHLPRDLMLGVLAHELFHAWQHERGADEGNAKWREGSANVAMYLLLSDLSSDLASYLRQSLENSPDPIYGDGFRKAIKYYNDHGMKTFLNKVVDKGN
ncbi:MAG: protein DA1 [Candidatus Electryonea clarkiae]|nr:protein DA1 [Candidatus Electryonea clarkiae]MDP8285813.1 protein DA1 [Candidatus Electryonea clarkiae]